MLSSALLRGAFFPLGATLGLAPVLHPPAARAQDAAAAQPATAVEPEPPAPEPEDDGAAEALAASTAKDEAPPPEGAAPPSPDTAAPTHVHAAAPQTPVPASSPSEEVVGGTPAQQTKEQVARAPEPEKTDASLTASSPTEPALVLPTVRVQGRGAEYHTPQSQLRRMATPLADTPQVVTVVPKDVIQEQRAGTVREALRNVSGITISAGEGGRQGDTFVLRGFSAQNDMFRDGARDLGWFTRDTFNLEGVEVFFGPSAVLFGRGATGGAVNLITKSPRRSTFAEVTLSGGSAPNGRIEADANDSLGDGAQVRATAMVERANVVGRDFVENNRAGFSPTARFRLAGATFLGVDYLYQRERNLPDYGQPFVNGRPVSKGQGVSRSTFYGVPGADKEEVDAHIASARLEQGLGPDLHLTHTVRLGAVNRLAIPTAPRNANATGLDRRRFRSQTDHASVVNQTDLRWNGATGWLVHAANLGLEVAWERRKQTRHDFELSGAESGGSLRGDLLSPDANPDLSGANLVFSNYRRGKMMTFAGYLSDQITLFEAVELLGSVRLDAFNTDLRTVLADGTRTNVEKNDVLFNWRGGLVIHPLAPLSLYGMVGSSSNPMAESGTLSNGTESLDPEQNRVFEAGLKAELFAQRLGLGGSLFRIEKTNARVPGADPMGPPQVLEGEQRVQGMNLGLSGTIVGSWKLLGNYTWLRSRIEKHTNPLVVGQALPGAAPHSASVWSTLTVADKLTFGAGAVYQAETTTNNPSSAAAILNRVPSYVRLDAFASYVGWKKVDLQLNLSNLTNALYYEQVSGAQAVPGQGRLVLVTARMRI